MTAPGSAGHPAGHPPGRAADAPDAPARPAQPDELDAFGDWPPVSVIMPVLDEAAHLRAAVERVLAQEYPGELEVVLAVGPSRDATAQIAASLAAESPAVRVVDNPSGATPHALNAALAASRHPVVVRVDGHALLPPGYVRRAVALLRETGADNVGGVMAAEGTTPFERAVATAMRSRLGVGSAPFHVGGEAGPVDTVYLGVFRRSTLTRLGGYDPAYLRAQDAELNHRIRQAGGTIWFEPTLEVGYRPRSSLRALAKQYLHYGRWRRVVMRQHPDSVRLRYLAPPVLLAGLSGSVVVAAVWWPPALVVPAAYAALLVGGGAAIGGGLPAGSRALLPLVLGTMHLSWAWGFVTSPSDLARDAAGAPAPHAGTGGP